MTGSHGTATSGDWWLGKALGRHSMNVDIVSSAHL
jgi:hypothetical protein